VLWLLFVVFFSFGAIFGSFACCQAERMFLKSEGKELGKRSQCLCCGHKLEWFELVPILSWIFLRGACRKCKNKIGKMELFSEIVMGVIFSLILWFVLKQAGLFGLIGGVKTVEGMSVGGAAAMFGVRDELGVALLCNPVVILRLVILLSSAVLFWILFVHDFKWQSLPSWILYVLIFLGIAYFVLNEMTSLGFMQEVGTSGVTKTVGKLAFSQQITFLKRDLVGLFGGLLILPGLYFVLYRFSKEKLVGGGDYLLTISMVLFIGRFELALTLLCVANLLALFLNVRKILRKKETKIAFGPYLILGFWIVLFLSQEILRYLYIVSV
jgi:leader peptidase (prepilin peptidase)